MWSAERVDQATLAALRERATADLSRPWPVPPAGDFARFRRDGNRTGYESAVFARDKRLSRAAVMAAVTLQPRWIDEVVDGVSLLCEQSTWCRPAHDDVFDRGAMVPDVSRPYLDLGAGEVAAQLAWIDHLLGAQLAERARAFGPGSGARVLTPFVARCSTILRSSARAPAVPVNHSRAKRSGLDRVLDEGGQAGIGGVGDRRHPQVGDHGPFLDFIAVPWPARAKPRWLRAGARRPPRTCR